MLIKPDCSSVLVIDIQEKLMPAIHQADKLLDHCRWLLEIAHYLDIPVLTTEQYPQGLGSTVATLAPLTQAGALVEKCYFSGVSDPDAQQAINQHCNEHVIIIGIETHICVLQTAIQLREIGKQVFVVADCTGSRCAANQQLAFERMRLLGIQIVSREMVVFEWLQKAGTEQFRYISKNYLR